MSNDTIPQWLGPISTANPDSAASDSGLDPDVIAAFAREKAAGNLFFLVYYSGSGDSGGIDGMQFSIDETYDHAAKGVTNSEASVLEELAYTLLERHYCGWENNDGGQGTIVVDLYTGEVKLEHEWNVTTTEDDYKSDTLWT